MYELGNAYGTSTNIFDYFAGDSVNIIAGYIKLYYIGSLEKLSGFIEVGVNFSSSDGELAGTNNGDIYNPEDFRRMSFY